MRYVRPALWLIVWLICWISGCSTTITGQGEHVSVEQFDSLRSVYYQLNDSLNRAWGSLKESDTQKLEYLDQLLGEFDDQNLIDGDTLILLQQMVQQLREIGFDSVTIANTRQVFQYDSLTLQVSDSLLIITNRVTRAELSPKLLYLTDKIISENSSTTLYRLHYDNISQNFNQFIEQHKELMSSLDSTGRPVFKRPMFKLVSDPPNQGKPE
ncbi:MAG: hypothetical protein AAF944_22050 [Bacteroidota bacterium]